MPGLHQNSWGRQCPTGSLTTFFGKHAATGKVKTLVTVCIGAAALGEEGMLVL